MRYENLKFEDIEFNIDSVDLQIEATDELIEITNNIRKEKGYKDLVEVDCDNEVYYNFYLVCYPEKNQVKILSVCNYGELDDHKIYALPMTSKEKENLTFQLVKEIIESM